SGLFLCVTTELQIASMIRPEFIVIFISQYLIYNPGMLGICHKHTHTHTHTHTDRLFKAKQQARVLSAQQASAECVQVQLALANGRAFSAVPTTTPGRERATPICYGCHTSACSGAARPAGVRHPPISSSPFSTPFVFIQRHLSQAQVKTGM